MYAGYQTTKNGTVEDIKVTAQNKLVKV